MSSFNPLPAGSGAVPSRGWAPLWVANMEPSSRPSSWSRQAALCWPWPDCSSASWRISSASLPKTGDWAASASKRGSSRFSRKSPDASSLPAIYNRSVSCFSSINNALLIYVHSSRSGILVQQPDHAVPLNDGQRLDSQPARLRTVAEQHQQVRILQHFRRDKRQELQGAAPQLAGVLQS
ncbi:hypothetical protein D3C76_1190480 [compost metagenome]